MSNFINYYFPIPLIENAVQFQKRKVIFNYPCESQNECHPFEVTFKKGIYQIECWGGGYNSSNVQSPYLHYGYGAYTKGTIHFPNTTKLYFYIGCSNGRFNVLLPDAKPNAILPNGATDIRTDKGDYYSFDSLKTRIMVAGAAGYSDDYDGQFGHGGTLQGNNGISEVSRTSGKPLNPPLVIPGGSQTNEYTNCLDKCIQGKFGLAQISNAPDLGGIGGGGYYSGASCYPAGNGGGGSSFISGFLGCDAISKDSTENNIIHTHQSVHYSKFVFTNGEMKSGIETHHMKPGKVIVTVLWPNETCQHKFTQRLTFLFFIFPLQFSSI